MGAGASLSQAMREEGAGQCLHKPERKKESEVVQSCPTLCDPMDCAYQAPLSMGFSRPQFSGCLMG